MTVGFESTKAGAGQEGQSRVQQLREGTLYLDPPKGRGKSFKDLWDDANNAVYNMTGRRMPGLSANAKFQQFLAGTDQETQDFNAFIDLFRERAKEAGADPEEIEAYVQAEQTKRRLEGDPRAAAMNVGEGVPEFAQYDVRKPEEQQVPSGQQVPPDQQIIDPTKQETSAVQTLYDQYGQPVNEPFNPNPTESPNIINPQSQV